MELQHDTPEDDVCTQPLESPSEMSESVWGRLIPSSSQHLSAKLNQAFELRDNEITMGRGSDNTITLPCPHLSSKHCRLIRQSEDVIFLQDTSTNGTWVNRKRIHKKRELLNDESEIM